MQRRGPVVNEDIDIFFAINFLVGHRATLLF